MVLGPRGECQESRRLSLASLSPLAGLRFQRFLEEAPKISLQLVRRWTMHVSACLLAFSLSLSLKPLCSLVELNPSSRSSRRNRLAATLVTASQNESVGSLELIGDAHRVAVIAIIWFRVAKVQLSNGSDVVVFNGDQPGYRLLLGLVIMIKLYSTNTQLNLNEADSSNLIRRHHHHHHRRRSCSPIPSHLAPLSHSVLTPPKRTTSPMLVVDFGRNFVATRQYHGSESFCLFHASLS